MEKITRDRFFGKIYDDFLDGEIDEVDAALLMWKVGIRIAHINYVLEELYAAKTIFRANLIEEAREEGENQEVYIKTRCC